MSVDLSGNPPVDLVGDLDRQLRAVVRREGVDPQLETTRVRRLAEELVQAHDERSLTGVVAPVPDPVGVVGELVARVSGFGALQRFLDDPEVEENCTFPRRSTAAGVSRRSVVGVGGCS
jgi:pilus assembly protein CpaF